MDSMISEVYVPTDYFVIEPPSYIIESVQEMPMQPPQQRQFMQGDMNYTDSSIPVAYPVPSVSPGPMSAIPSSNRYAGDLNFSFEFDKQLKDTKSTAWTYSTITNKLYARLDALCPVKFKVSPPHQHQQLYIRALPVYSKPDNIQDVVKRCPNHVQAPESASVPHKNHLVWCEHQSAQYLVDYSSRRLAVVAPLDPPAPGSDWTTFLFSFKCLNSCPGGVNRRETSLIFTLEDERGQVLGRHAIDLRICACPGRDKAADERKATNPSTPASNEPVTTGASPAVTVLNHTPPDAQHSGTNTGISSPQNSYERALKRPHSSIGGREIFTLQVEGRHNYEVLKRVRDSLEMADRFVPVRDRELYQHQQRSNEQRLHPQTSTAANPPPSRVPPPSLAFSRTPMAQGMVFSSAPRPTLRIDPVNSTRRGGLDMTDGGAAPPVTAVRKSLSEFLSDLQLSPYLDDFLNAGIRSLSQLCQQVNGKTFSKQNLMDMKFTQPTVNKIWNALKQYQSSNDDEDTVTSCQPDSQQGGADSQQGGADSQQGGADSQASTVILSQSSNEGASISRPSSGRFWPDLFGFSRCSSLKVTVTRRKKPTGQSSSAATSSDKSPVVKRERHDEDEVRGDKAQ